MVVVKIAPSLDIQTSHYSGNNLIQAKNIKVINLTGKEIEVDHWYRHDEIEIRIRSIIEDE